MTPVGDGTTVNATHVFGYSWIPFVQVQIHRLATENRGSNNPETGAPDPTRHRSYLTVKTVNHFTYADA
jgi:hypothetical protein